jgi:Tol biopolymer transport system component
MNAVGGDVRRHTFGSSQFTAAAYPSWSPDGRMIAFEVLEVDPSFLTQSHILILDLESGALYQVPDLPPSVRFPAWSPVP